MEEYHLDMNKQTIESDIDLLRNGRIHEIKKAVGFPKCSTLADRIQENLDLIIDFYEEQLGVQKQMADREQFDLLSGMLIRLDSEIADLSKKQPDGLVNTFKVNQINRVLKPLKEMMSEEPSALFLDLVAEVEDGADRSRNSYSDVAVILCQFREACGEYRSKHYDKRWDINL